ncbi:MarR family winged helix-turn-helix transcriptional regulator [Terasakiella sp. A23]|uniref:MarR family winged helix-turn-helix transcriptional regulator n=1 Tax=Terasakiella sp. FCG-A23 TaxID=3080561 RepID=UPI002953BF88|nr:MarR family winged helix-turn-helix transcriptional regulator [Terasakiella sp. A23]MDV7341561.1 MarR family winged helix-turn-helix transcriptional regulator [Terasakiella sp. A23]
MDLNPADCVSYRLRRAARVAAKYYDAALKPLNLRNTQFTLLAALSILEDTSIGNLSKELAIDGTTLTRNLDVLFRRGLIEDQPDDDGRVRNIRLTQFGKDTYQHALPLWQEAQTSIVEQLGASEWQTMITQLKDIENASL